MKANLMLATLVASCGSLCAQWFPPTNQLIDKWEFSGSSFVSGINGISPLNNTATLPTFVSDRCGTANSAVHFDPSQSQHLEYAVSSLPLQSAPRSVSFWMRTSNTTVGGANTRAMFAYGRTHEMPVLSGQPANNAGGTFELNHNYCSNGIGLDLTNEAITRSLTCLTNNAWHHVVAVWAPTSSSDPYVNIQFWVDGNLVSSSSCQITGTTQQMLTQASNLFFGSNANVGGTTRRYFEGDLDDIYFYSRPLNTNEIQALFNAQCGITGTTCVTPYQTYNFTTPAYTGATYAWTVPSGWTNMSGGTTTNMSVIAGSGPGIVQVAITTGCGTFIRSMPVLISPNCSTVIPDPPVDPEEGCCLGNTCGDSPNPLAADYEIQLNTHDFNFSGNQSEKVNVGYNCGSAGEGKLNAYTDQNTSSIPEAESISVYGLNLSAAQDGQGGVGVMGVASNPEAQIATGVWGDATSMYNNTGGRFFAGSQEGQNGFNVGVSGVARPSTGAPAPFMYKAFYPGGANVGVYGAGELNNSPDPNNPGPDWAGWFDGDVKILGTSYANLFFTTSDKRLKKEIKPISDVTSRMMKLTGYTYKFRSDEFKDRGLDKASHLGLIAQEVLEVFPELITKDARGMYGIDYQGMIPVLLEAAKEQQQKISSLEGKVAELEKRATGIMDSQSGADYNIFQNEPNPFTYETTIKYLLPETTMSAFLIVYDLTGKQLKKFDLPKKGAAEYILRSEDLEPGIYIYTILADGKTLDSRRMIIADK